MEMSDDTGGKLPTQRTPTGHAEGVKRLTYARPELRFYGNVGELTASGSGISNEPTGKMA